MFALTKVSIRKVADSRVIYERGLQIYQYGSFNCTEALPEKGLFLYEVDGSYGDYTTEVHLENDRLRTSCNCPYPGSGCKHTVAVLFDAADRLGRWQLAPPLPAVAAPATDDGCLTAEEIRLQALEDRRKRAKSEKFTPILGDMLKGEHLLKTDKGLQYCVTLHNPEAEVGHCSCPDFLHNRLGTCKHIIHLSELLRRKKNFKSRLSRERFPFIDIYWDSASLRPRLFHERPAAEIIDLNNLLSDFFDTKGLFSDSDLGRFVIFLDRLGEEKRVRVREEVLHRVDRFLDNRQLGELASETLPALDGCTAKLYPYQEEGVRFCLFRKAALIGDEMGLGKTLQAIATALLKKQVFGFDKVLIVTLASLKDQWQREIRRFTREEATVIAGGFKARQTIYQDDPSLFKITNYEAVRRDGGTIARFKPDLIILDEAQRIKNFSTKTAEAVKNLPRKHALVLTGTPLENKLEDLYSIIQFLDPDMLSPLWQFAADHFMLSREQKGRLQGYRNLDRLHERLKGIVIRRRKEEVLKELPAEVTNNYYIDLHERQAKMHSGYAQALMPLLHKKFLTPMDLRRIQELLLCMRRVCDSTYLIDRKSNISPKLTELAGILDELLAGSNRKVVIFSEWTAMTFLIGKHLSEAGISFVELSGKIPVAKRQRLIDEFTNNPACRVFLSTDAGGTGLNLQAADCVINFELPWNPARLNQRAGRVSRIGQKSQCVNIINLIAKQSIEEKILAGIQLKTDLFKGVLDGEGDMVEFSREKRAELLNRLREMMGEEPVAVVRDTVSEEIPEDTPHYLNPQALAEEEQGIAYDAEEAETELPVEEAAANEVDTASAPRTSSPSAESNPERMEAVLNKGMDFLSGLLEMATGQKITPSDDEGGKLLTIDRQTGVVTMKFKLPGF